MKKQTRVVLRSVLTQAVNIIITWKGRIFARFVVPYCTRDVKIVWLQIQNMQSSVTIVARACWSLGR